MSSTGNDGTSADFIVVANRLPVDLERLPDGQVSWKRSPGGLVSAIEPFLRSRSGAWVGWPGVPGEEVDPFGITEALSAGGVDVDGESLRGALVFMNGEEYTGPPPFDPLRMKRPANHPSFNEAFDLRSRGQ